MALGEGKPRWLRSLIALLAGMVFVVGLSVATDIVMQAAGVFPPGTQPKPDPLLALAFGYRTVYGILGSWLTARLSPYRPMAHSLVGGCVGFVGSLLGAVATWNRPDTQDAHWYPVLLVITALPYAWLGAKLHERWRRAGE